MKRSVILILSIALFYVTSCGDPNNKEPELKNEASITIRHVEVEDSIKTPKQFPAIPEPLMLKISEVITTEGSFSSVEMYFDNIINGVSYKLNISLPASDKFGMKNNNDGGIEFITDSLPCIIDGKDYKPYPNALDGGPHSVKATLEVSDETNELHDFLDFQLDKLMLYEINEEKGKFSAHFKFIGTPGEISTIFYGKYTAEISVNVTDQEMSLMMVD